MLASIVISFSVFFCFAANKSDEMIEKNFDIVWPGGIFRTLKVYSPKKESSSLKSVLIYFHSTDFPVYLDRPEKSPFGLYHESQLIKKLVTKHRFVVIAPDASYNYGSFAWQTNLNPYFFNFKNSPDYDFAAYLFANLKNYYPHVKNKVFVGGLSSGGYMASRMAILPEFAKNVQGVFVHSASYATCISYYCYIPEDIPKTHPPALLIASRYDPLVPEGTIEQYQKRLEAAGIPARLVTRHGTWHGMYEADVKLISDWLTKF